MIAILSKPFKAGIANLHVSKVDLSSLNLFYDLSWFLLKLQAGPNLRLWTRNSYHFKCHIPGLSDIDISVLSKETPEGFLLYRNVLKLVFPWIGEVNWYPEMIAQDMCSLANKVEMSRDPVLTGLYLKEGAQASDAEKFVFLLRMIDYDLACLRSNPAARVRKWAYHWSLLKPNSSAEEKRKFCHVLSLDNIIEFALEFVPAGKKELVHARLMDIFFDSGRCDWLMPHKYLNLYDFDVSACETIYPEVTQAQIDWEFWGVCTQAYWLPKSSFQDHLEKLDRLKWDAYSTDRHEKRQNILKHIQENF
jgi:hypothetical protein